MKRLQKSHPWPRLVATAGLITLLGTVWASPALAAPSETWTTVLHNTTSPTTFISDDICGPRASYETWFNTVEVNHLTASDDGSFHFVDFETGSIRVDYLDPDIPDASVRRTETFAVNLTPGGTYTNTATLRQTDSNGLTIRFLYHLNVTDGEPKIEREVLVVTGCPT